MQEKFRKCDKINFRLKHFNPLDPNTYAIISSDPRHRIFSPFEASSQGETSLLQKFPPSLSLSLPSDVSWYTKVKRTGQEGHLKLPYVTTLFPPRTSCINSAFGRMCPGNPRNISHPRPRFLVKVICCTPYGFEKEGGQAERKWFREKPCITEIFTFYQKGFVIDVKKKIGSFLILSLIFPTIQRNFLYN